MLKLISSILIIYGQNSFAWSPFSFIDHCYKDKKEQAFLKCLTPHLDKKMTKFKNQKLVAWLYHNQKTLKEFKSCDEKTLKNYKIRSYESFCLKKDGYTTILQIKGYGKTKRLSVY